MASSLRAPALVAALLAPLFVAPGAARAYHLDDTLRGGTTGVASGGTFGADGWTVTGTTDRLQFAIPSTSQSGSIEFTVTNLTNASLFVGDNDVFNLYDAADSSEPIPYRPDFVENNYKVWIRIRNEPGFYGNQKLTVGVCPDSAVSHSPSCACGTGFIDEVTGGDPTWDGTAQRLRIEWGGGSVRFLRNGAEVDRIDFSATGYAWGPRALHFTIGSTRSLAIGTSGMPVGAVFSDLVVDTVDGPVASCPAAPPPTDGGVCDPGASGATADTTAAVWEPAVYSLPADLNVEGDGSAPTGVVYLRFPPAGGTVTHAVLRVHTQLGSSSAGGSGQVCQVIDDTWDESTMTWATRPAVGAACTGGAHAVGVNEEVEWDVTSLATGTGDLNFAIVSTDTDGAHFYSGESGGCTLGPRLYLTLGPPAPDLGTASDASTAPDTGTTPMDAATSSDLGADASHTGGHTTGACGCRVAGARGASGGGAVALGVVLALGVARRRRATARARRTRPGAGTAAARRAERR